MTTTTRTPCTHCQGLGTIGGSFPGIFGPVTPGKTCGFCNGSGEERASYRPLTPPTVTTPEDLDFGNVVREMEIAMNPEASEAAFLAREVRGIEHPTPNWDKLMREARGKIKPPIYNTSEGRMQAVADQAVVLTWAEQRYREAPWDMTAAKLCIWRAHWEHAYKQYTDPFGTKTYEVPGAVAAPVVEDDDEDFDYDDYYWDEDY
jgi:hypothetical protein